MRLKPCKPIGHEVHSVKIALHRRLALFQFFKFLAQAQCAMPACVTRSAAVRMICVSAIMTPPWRPPPPGGAARAGAAIGGPHDSQARRDANIIP